MKAAAAWAGKLGKGAGIGRLGEERLDQPPGSGLCGLHLEQVTRSQWRSWRGGAGGPPD